MRRRSAGKPRPCRRDAERRARKLASTLNKLRIAGIVTYRAVASELNRRRVPTIRGGRWHPTSVGRVLRHLGLTVMSGRRGGNGAETIKRNAESRAQCLSLTVNALRAEGFVTYRAMVDELNRREIATAGGGLWHPTSLGRVLKRLGMTVMTGKRG